MNCFAAACEEMRGNSSAGAGAAVYRSETVVCPKPRRLGLIQSTLNEPSYVRPLRWHASHHKEVFDSNELLDIIILAKDDCVSDQVASSPPFFSGSPPSRASNPIIQDARFGEGAQAPVSPRALPAPSSLGPSPRKGGCIRANFGNNPVVRVEGFDCLDRDRRGCSIPALA